MQLLLQEYAEVFVEPTHLPSIRIQDHRISLKDETQTVRLRPYKYPSIQKDELEKMIQQMLEVGIIRNSCSSFASPVLMVKKKNGS